jgi:hypothetical protein
MNRKEKLLSTLMKFARQRSGIEFGNYGDMKAFNSERRKITRDLAIAHTLMRAVAWRDSITADSIIDASHRAFSGRITINEVNGEFTIDYCTGQYFPTEYRKAVCSVLSTSLWDSMRDTSTQLTGDVIRNTFRREFGKAIQSKYFN